VHNFLTAGQCAALRDASLAKLAPSLVNIKAKLPWLPDKEGVDLDVKKAMTNPIGYLPWNKDDLHERLHGYVNASFGWDSRHAEMLFVNRYEPGGFYKVHHDGAQRTVTVLLYLNDQVDGEGGSTTFPQAAPKPLLVQPQEGMALVFYNVLPTTREIDMSALHSGEPAQSTKWVANLWLHEEEIHLW
jgi:prolyl 4-hydroxylase